MGGGSSSQIQEEIEVKKETNTVLDYQIQKIEKVNEAEKKATRTEEQKEQDLQKQESMLQDRIDKAREDMEKMKKLRLDLEETDPLAPKTILASPTQATDRTIVKGLASPRDEGMITPASKRPNPGRNEQAAFAKTETPSFVLGGTGLGMPMQQGATPQIGLISSASAPMTQPNSPFANRLQAQTSSPTVAHGGHNPADDADLSDDDDIDKQTSFFGSVKRDNSQGAAPVVNSPNKQSKPKQKNTKLFGNDSEEEDDDFDPEGRDDPGINR